MNLPRPKFALAPEEGWVSLLLVAAMAIITGWSLDDAGWVLGNEALTNFLPLAAVLGVMVGFVGSKVGWNRWVAHVIGASFAALIVSLLVGQVLLDGGSPHDQFLATAHAAGGAWSDLIVRGLRSTHQTGHHLLVLGLLCWGTGQFAASAVFRHRRPLSAVVVIGTILVGNMAATVDGQLGYMMLFSVAALFLLVRLHALDERTTWLRRRIGDPTAVSSIYLRGCTAFIVVAVVGSFVLTATARSSPLAGAWDDVKPWLLDVTAAIQRFLPTSGTSRSIGGVQFGPTTTIRNVWAQDNTLAMTIQRRPGDNRHYYWRITTYDRFDLFGWSQTESSASPRQPDEDLLTGTLDELRKEGNEQVTFTVTPAEYRGPYAVSPLAPASISESSEVLGLGDDGFFEALQINGRDPYTVTALVPILGELEPGGLTENLLRVAGRDYPKEVSARYLPQTPGAVGPEAEKVLAEVMDRISKDPTRSDNPYDVASVLVKVLQSGEFAFDENVAEEFNAKCGDRSVTECFALVKRGYCEHYASLMAALLRAHGIPSRYVMGFLPGSLDPLSGVEDILWSNGHAWVEVYFPGYGWVSFDPTGGPAIGVAEPIPSGKPVASRPPSPVPSFVGGSQGPEGPIRRSPGALSGTPGGDGTNGPGGIIIVSILLLATLAALGFLVWQRGPRGPTTPEGVYAGVARLAARFGFGPRPTQTAYEYATALGEVLPQIRPELMTVATAKVEVAYGRRTLGDDRIRALRESYRRLRVSLLRLLFRRRSLRRRR